MLKLFFILAIILGIWQGLRARGPRGEQAAREKDPDDDFDDLDDWMFLG